ncbi:hypothetical protein D1872_207220 [compost metagenome]
MGNTFAVARTHDLSLFVDDHHRIDIGFRAGKGDEPIRYFFTQHHFGIRGFLFFQLQQITLKLLVRCYLESNFFHILQLIFYTD